MSNRRLEVFHYRQALHQMQQGLSDRAIGKSGIMGRHKASQLRALASGKGWLEPGLSLAPNCRMTWSWLRYSMRASAQQQVRPHHWSPTASGLKVGLRRVSTAALFIVS